MVLSLKLRALLGLYANWGEDVSFEEGRDDRGSVGSSCLDVTRLWSQRSGL